MTITLTPIDEFTDIAAPENAESGDAGDLIVTTIQPLANRTQFLARRTVGGSTAVMLALPNVVEGWRMSVTTPEFGWYEAHASSLGLGSPWEYASTGTPGIYWRRSDWAITVQGPLSTRGICRFGPIPGYDDTTPENRIPEVFVPNRAAYHHVLTAAGHIQQTVTAGTVTNIANSICGAVDVVAGDILMGEFGSVNVYVKGTSGFTLMRLRITEYGGSPYTIGYAAVPPNGDYGSGKTTLMIPFYHEIATTGAMQLQLQCETNASGDSILYAHDSVILNIGHMTIYRP